MIVLITGATGLIGSILCEKLIANNHQVRILSRSSQKIKDIPCYLWKPEQGVMDENALIGVEAIIHLAGANIFEKRWTANRKRTLINSRVETANLLFSYCKKVKPSLKLFLSASAVGWYGATADQDFVEEMESGNDFLANVCLAWETAANQFKDLPDCKVAKLRTPMVFAKNAKSYLMMKIPVNYYLGAILGNGYQFTPWVHIDDLCAVYLAILDGVIPADIYNIVAPEKVRYKEMMSQVAYIQGRKIILPNIHPIVLTLLLGERASLLLTSQRVNVDKLISVGFKFRYPRLREALEDLS